MPKDQKGTGRSARGFVSRPTTTAAGSRSGPATRSLTHFAVDSQSPFDFEGSRHGSRHPVVSQPAIRDGNYLSSEGSPLAHSAIPAVEPAGWFPTSRSSTNGAFNNAHHVVFNQPVFVEGAHPKEKYCIDLLTQNVIPGAHFDSGERYPPPSCHPGTRLDISEKLISWVRDLMREHKLLWLHGPAGIGKSAVIQTITESEASSSTSVLGATIFFSKPNKRNDPQRVFITIAYQLAVKYPEYRAYVVELLMVDPLLVKKSLVEQFKWFIVKPFGELLEETHGTVLVTLDGLDECNGELAQREIISLISKFCLEHPTTPLTWVITSRTEPEIRAAFSHRDVKGTYTEIDMPIDSDQACRDVELYLRDAFTKIKEKYSTSFSSTQQWPTETDFTKITKRSSGLFAFANTVACFTGDVEYANPVAQLQKLLNVLESPSSPAAGDSPFAALDMIYTLILSSISPKVLPITRRLLLIKNMPWSLIKACNILSISQADAYGALRKLHSVLRIPLPGKALFSQIEVFHKSFDDFLESPSRSGSFWLDPLEADSLVLSASARILLEAHDPSESVIRPSSINISWPGEGMEMYRVPLFERSLWSVLKAPLGWTSGFDKLCHFFEDIDYASLETILPRAFQEDIIHKLLGSPLVPSFEERGLIATFPIQFLDLSFIGMNDPAYIFSTREDATWLKCRRFYEHVPSCHHCKIFEVPGPKPKPWSGKRIFLWDEPHWMVRIHDDFGDLPPPHPVTVLGKGNKRLVLIDIVDINDPEEKRVYMLPYRPS